MGALVLIGLVLLPLLAGAGIWALAPAGGARLRVATGAAAAAALLATLALALAAGVGAAADPGTAVTWPWGAGLELAWSLPPLAAVVAATVPAVALAATGYAAAHEARGGLRRLVGLLVAFVGAMELVVVAADLLSLIIGWELVAAVSWALIGHEWRDPSRATRATHALVATRAGGLGLLLAAGATFAATGGVSYADLATLDGGALHVAAAGVVAAAAAKSAQVPFAPWLLSAMAGPTSVSALLHSATMVAAGAYLLVRLQPALAPTGWFAPVVVGVGLATALAGGVVALVQSRIKHVLAASTSAHYGLMLVAVGAGFPLVATAHLVAHAAFKALLFLAAGVAISAAGSEALADLAVGRQRRVTAGLALVGALALAAVPPLGAAWSKEQIVAAAFHTDVLLRVGVIVAGGLSAAYIARLQLLAFGRRRPTAPARELAHPPGRVEHAAMGGLALACLASGAVWLAPVEHAVGRLGSLAPAAVWELVASLAAVAAGAGVALAARRAGWLSGRDPAGVGRVAGQWLGLASAGSWAVVRPTRWLAAGAARADDVAVDGGVRGVALGGTRAAAGAARADTGVVDAGVRGLAALARLAAQRGSRLVELGVDDVVGAVAAGLGWGGQQLRRLQTGAAPRGTGARRRSRWSGSSCAGCRPARPTRI